MPARSRTANCCTGQPVRHEQTPSIAGKAARGGPGGSVSSSSWSCPRDGLHNKWLGVSGGRRVVEGSCQPSTRCEDPSKQTCGISVTVKRSCLLEVCSVLPLDFCPLLLPAELAFRRRLAQHNEQKDNWVRQRFWQVDRLLLTLLSFCGWPATKNRRCRRASPVTEALSSGHTFPGPCSGATHARSKTRAKWFDKSRKSVAEATC